MSIHKSCRKMCPDFIVNDFVTKIIKTVPIRAGYNTIRVTLKNDRATDKTLSFCALTSLSVVCRKGCLVDIVDVVVKSAPKNKKLRECIPVNGLFTRETFFYNTILADLLEFQDEINVNVEDQFQKAQILIAATLKEGEEAIILQNSGAGWVPKYEKWVGELTQEHILTVLKELARFHALNFAFAQKKPEKFQEFKKELKGGFFSTLENHQSEKIIKNNLSQILKYFNEDNIVKRLKSFSDDVGDFLENVLTQDNDVTVLIHGDPTSNFLFSYEKSDENNTPSRAKITDWQLVKCGSPVLDLSLFLFTNCSLEDLNHIDFLKAYYTNLEFFSKQFKTRISDYFSFKSLEKDWKQFAKFGLALSSITLKILTMESSKKPNANNEDLSSEEFLNSYIQPPNGEFIRRMKDVVKYCVEKELI